ncbi:MAG: hypothetical protein K6G51_01885 [Sphaerochaetaceae bacterium]|nr:hypothetical protein [Sphaerochaetaceae bacterium]
MSKCKEKYGREWSASLNESTRDHFEKWGFGLVKHIGKIDARYAINVNLFGEDKLRAEVPEADRDKDIFLYTFTDYDFLLGPKGLKYYMAYDTIEDLIDDGWAID